MSTCLYISQALGFPEIYLAQLGQIYELFSMLPHYRFCWDSSTRVFVFEGNNINAQKLGQSYLHVQSYSSNVYI